MSSLFFSCLLCLVVFSNSWIFRSNLKLPYVRYDLSVSFVGKSCDISDNTANILTPIIREMKDKAFHGLLSNDEILANFVRFEKEEIAFQALFRKSKSLSDLLWALGRVNFQPIDEFSYKSLFRIIESFITVHNRKHSISDATNLVALSKGFVGISRMQVKWQELTPSIRAGLSRILELNIDNMGIQSIANTIHA